MILQLSTYTDHERPKTTPRSDRMGIMHQKKMAVA